MLTSIQVFKVTEKPTHYQKQLINSIALKDIHFSKQAIEIKKLIRDYKPREVLIDGTGLGVGLLDFLVLEQVSDQGELFPSYASVNDDEYSKYAGEKLIYVLKANGPLNSKIHSNCYAQIANGHCRFLIDEQQAKLKIQSTQKGAKMRPEEKIHRLSPHFETTKLFEEICNLRIKATGNDTVVERINNRINKDRFSAFEYGLWRIKEMEDEHFKSLNRKKLNFKDFVFFSKGGM